MKKDHEIAERSKYNLFPKTPKGKGSVEEYKIIEEYVKKNRQKINKLFPGKQIKEQTKLLAREMGRQVNNGTTVRIDPRDVCGNSYKLIKALEEAINNSK